MSLRSQSGRDLPSSAIHHHVAAMSRRLLIIARRLSIGVFMCPRLLPPLYLPWGHEAVCIGVRWLSSEQGRLTCWSCGKLIRLPEDSVQFFCPCENRVVLPPTTDNYFEIMGWYVVMLYLPPRPSEGLGQNLAWKCLESWNTNTAIADIETEE